MGRGWDVLFSSFPPPLRSPLRKTLSRRKLAAYTSSRDRNVDPTEVLRGEVVAHAHGVCRLFNPSSLSWRLPSLCAGQCSLELSARKRSP